MFIAGIFGLLDGKPRVTLTDTGLTVRAMGRYEIPWQEIKSARIESLPRAGNLIILELRNGRRHRVAGDFLEITPRRLLSMIEAHLGKYSTSEA